MKQVVRPQNGTVWGAMRGAEIPFSIASIPIASDGIVRRYSVSTRTIRKTPLPWRTSLQKINRLWERIQNVSGDMFLTLRGLSGGTRKSRCVSQQWLLKLFAWYPDLTTWQSFTRDGIARVIDEHRTNIIDRIMVLKDVAVAVAPYSAVAQGELKVSASTALALKQSVRLLYHQIEAEAAQNAFTCRLMEYGGIGAITTAQIVSEVADISRFPNDDHLASYAGLGRREHKTGTGITERSTFMFNHRLKNTFFTAARNYTLYNPEPEPAGNDSLKQPNTSQYERKYTPDRSRKSKRTSSAMHHSKKEVNTAYFR